MITGGMKFFTKSKCLLQDGASILASSGNAAAPRCLDRNPISYWRSVGSDDTITETLDITLSEAKAFSRLLLLDHNFKSFTVKYYDGATYVDFTNVVGLSGAQGAVSETVYAADTAYYEFDEVTATQIRITATLAQVVDDQKRLNQFVIASELGTLAGFPQIKSLELSRNMRTEKMLSGRALVFKSDPTFSVELAFKDYPSSLSADVDLIFSLQDLEDTFLVWVCGGRQGSPYFRKQMRGYRLRDLIAVQLVSNLKPIYSNNVFTNPLNFSAQLSEAVD